MLNCCLLLLLGAYKCIGKLKGKKNTERLKLKDLNIWPNILHVDFDADIGGI